MYKLFAYNATFFDSTNANIKLRAFNNRIIDANELIIPIIIAFKK